MIPIPNTQSASYGVAGFNGKVEIKFDEEIAVLLREIVENFEEVAVTCEKKRA
jgi:predicted component of type VI protein secretion system